MLEKLHTWKVKSYHRFFAKGSGKHVNIIVAFSISLVYFILVQDFSLLCQKPNCSSNPHKDILQAVSQVNNKLKMLNWNDLVFAQKFISEKLQL